MASGLYRPLTCAWTAYSHTCCVITGCCQLFTPCQAKVMQPYPNYWSTNLPIFFLFYFIFFANWRAFLKYAWSFSVSFTSAWSIIMIDHSGGGLTLISRELVEECLYWLLSQEWRNLHYIDLHYWELKLSLLSVLVLWLYF